VDYGSALDVRITALAELSERKKSWSSASGIKQVGEHRSYRWYWQIRE
jgi:hypothetical protein